MRCATACVLWVVSVLGVVAVEPPLPQPAETFFKKGDVVALIGGEDMVVAAELGYFELLALRALPEHRLRFRSLAWEGDTVFEQRRDLNFPSWEEQLDAIGATVVLCQFGQMESFAGRDQLPPFLADYEKLLARFAAGGKRRLVVLEPFAFAQGDLSATELTAPRLARHEALTDYSAAARNVAERAGALWIGVGEFRLPGSRIQRDGCHLTRPAHAIFALDLARKLQLEPNTAGGNTDMHAKLLALVAAKNRLWFDYWRVQNWAFLYGDRTVQPSSRDHVDPSKRWFPGEREAFLPLIEAKEKEIWSLSAQLAKP
jgi:hypothetical protein